MIKQRKESLVQFQAGNRQDLVDKESAEIVFSRLICPRSSASARSMP